ncbi:antitoxin HicB [Candidatus Falkowbacteria bacterium CG10_big_fil_rev_8_21_14_0_10_43_11]|uniref:Antitoxin HicB n=1 Tax=Candidatus Falkowbacteria bacterium CG10_big_fil_rev_8_21_14_0_10_43_11 TaxID=1974568 RepID=A0A2M6WL76_9BACT|nr:MAG: antitoxin HicB [Candidatus Falkowbacteria bacterium CG10_big_fil_rev_8_21_14_0_10_43_11]
MQNLRYHLIFRPEPEGGFTVIVPSLPGCISYGKNLTEAKKMARDAIKGYITSLKKHHEPVPTDDEVFISSINIEQPAAKLKLQYA